MAETALFASLVEDVYSLTSRPDLVAQTKYAIRAATLKAHQSDFYSKDIYETGIAFPTAEYRQSFDYIDKVPNYRAFKYFKRVEDECDSDGTPINIITPEELLDDYKMPKKDVAYVAGHTLQINSSVAFDKALIGVYVNPIVIPENYCSWVATMHPNTIVYEAARVIFKTIGYDEQAATYEKLVAEGFLLLKLSAIQDVGY